MKKIILKNKDFSKMLNDRFKNCKCKTIFYNQSLSSDYKKVIYNNKNNIVAIFYSDILFNNNELIIF